MSHRESNLLRRRFSVNLSRCLGPKPAFRSSKIFLASLRRCSLRRRRLLRRLTSPRRSGDRAKSWATVRPVPSILPQHLHLIYACVNFQLVNLGVRDARAFKISHVWPSTVGVGARDPHHQSHLSRARAPSLSSPDGESGKTNTSTIFSARARACAFARVTKRRR